MAKRKKRKPVRPFRIESAELDRQFADARARNDTAALENLGEAIKLVRNSVVEENGGAAPSEPVTVEIKQKPTLRTAYRQAIQAVTAYVALVMAVFYAWLNGPAKLSGDWEEFWNQEDVRYAWMMVWCAIVVTPRLATEYREVLIFMGLAIVALLLYAGLFGGWAALR